MKLTYLFPLFILSLMIGLQPVQGQTYAHAGEYMTAINEQYAQLMEDQWSYIKASSHSRNARKIEKRRREVVATNRDIRNKIRRMQPYDGDASLRDSVVSFLDIAYYVINDDYERIVDLEAIAEDSYDMMEAYLTAKEQANDKLNDAGQRLSEHEHVFAETHNIELLEAEQSKTARRLEQASKTISYYNRLYLVFFKSYKQELYLISAVEEGNVGAMLQNQNALIATTQEGLGMLDTISAFEGDRSVIEACRTMLMFYQREAKESIPIYSDFFVKKETSEQSQESFARAQAAFEAIKPKNRKQEDVDRYNAAVAAVNEAGEAYNAAVASYNDTNESLNKERSRLLSTYNKTVDKFVDRHVP